MSVDININENINSSLTNVYNTMVDINRVSQTFNQNISNTAGIQNINIHLGDIINSYEEINRQQVEFNQFVTEGGKKTSGLLDKIKSIGDKVSSITNSDNVFDLAVNYSDNIADINSSVAKINDGSQSDTEFRDKVYGASMRSRTDMGSTLSTVEGLSGAGFNNDEAIQYTENLNKMFAIAGVGQEAQAAASGEMVNALADGIVAGEELNSMMSATPEIVTAMAENMGMPVEGMAQLAEQGKLTADMLKNSMLGATGSIDAQFANTKTTWSQTVTNMTTMATMAFEPVGAKINDIINSPSFTAAINGIAQGFANIAPVIAFVLDGVSALGGFVVDNFGIIAPIILGIAAALAIYAIGIGIMNTLDLISTGLKIAACIASYAYAAATGSQASATAAATAAQYGLNTALLLCPLTWIVLAIIAVIAAIFLVIAVINKASGSSISATGVIIGAFSVVWAFIKNLGLAIADIFMGIWARIKVIASNIQNAFMFAVNKIKSFFWDMASVVFSLIAKIATSLNKLPFVHIDVEGLTSKADEYKAKSEAANKAAELNKNSIVTDFKYEKKYNAFQDGWAENAYKSGYNKGDNLFGGDENTGLGDSMQGLLGGSSTADVLGKSGGLNGVDMSNYSGMLEGNGVDMATMGNISTSTQGAMNNTYAVSENTAGTNENSGQLVNIGNSILEIMRKNMENQMNKPAQNITFDMSGMNNNISSSVEGKTFIDALTNEIIGKMNAGAEGAY